MLPAWGSAIPETNVMTENKPEPSPHAGSEGPLERYMAVLELIVGFPGSLTLSDIAGLLDLPKTTVHRLLRGLIRADLAKSGAAGRAYVPGDRLTRLLYASTDGGHYATLARPHLTALAEETHEACYLTKLQGTRVIVVASQAPEVRWRSYVQPGIEMAPHAAATAKAILAFQEADMIEAILQGSLPKLAINTRTDRAWVFSEFEKVHTRGYATCIGEIDDGLAAIAVPIRQEGGLVIHSLGITGPIQRIINDLLPERIATMNRIAATLAEKLRLGELIKAR
ncbi:IclR family transcriptional regulator [Oleispirillum naphthae]|uniref:IclR family transcriptional regulator n=1 Tax=Oleispirillum naphthae TaxID=2838853 RepID=UPI0030824AB6